MKAISIKQPWAYLIVHGIKDIENRTWKCPNKYIGQRVLIHASEKPVKEGWDALTEEQHNELPWYDHENVEISIDKLPKSAIIGSVKIVDCVINHPSVWAEKTDENYNSFCRNQMCEHYIEWNCGYGDCVSCKLQGESHDITDIAESCKFKTNTPKPIYNWVLAEPILYENPIEDVKGKLSFWEYDGIEEVTIECPECGYIQPAVFDRNEFIPITHDCKYCGHLIEEFDLNKGKEEVL